MPSRTRTEITIQTRRVTVVKGLRIRCPKCAAEVSITTRELAAEALQTTPQEIEQLINQGALHPVNETPNARLICAESLNDEGSDPSIRANQNTSVTAAKAAEIKKGEER